MHGCLVMYFSELIAFRLRTFYMYQIIPNFLVYLCDYSTLYFVWNLIIIVYIGIQIHYNEIKHFITHAFYSNV